jgi:hypothetical protein
MQHALAALRMPSVACWVVNKPKVFGYDLHTHILANPYTIKPELRNAFLNKFNIGGDELEFPYVNESQIFDVDTIIKALKDEPKAAEVEAKAEVISKPEDTNTNEANNDK